MAKRDVVVVAASAGGIEALRDLLGGLPADYAGVVAVVLHMSTAGGTMLPAILDKAGPLHAVAATHGAPLQPGHVYVCQPGHHLLLGEGVVLVRRGPQENGHRPAADPLFRSAARYYGPRAVGVVLSGLLSDGTAGLHTIRRAGGTAVVQSPEDAQYEGMVQSALEHVGADHVLAAREIGPLLAELAKTEVDADDWLVDPPLTREVSLMESDDSVLEQRHPGRPSEWPCPDCDGVLWEIDDQELLRFRCRVGHAWSAESLLHQQAEHVETALWVALRALEDRAALSRRMAEAAETAGRTLSGERFRADLEDLHQSIATLRRMVHDEGVNKGSEG